MKMDVHVWCLTMMFVAALVLPADAGVFGWGSNVGDGTFIDRNKPTAVETSGALSGKIVRAISGGFSHSVALASDGRVFTWGNNAFGQLGNSSTATTWSSPAPVAVSTNGALAGRTVTAIAAGAFHTVARTSDGKLFAWGDNSDGQLGDGTTTDRSSPVAVNMNGALAGKSVTVIAAGWSHCVALTSDGMVFAWGSNFAGQLGDGTTTDRSSPVAVNMNGVLAGKIITAIAAGGYHTLALTSDGKIFAWGNKFQGQLGAGIVLVGNGPVAVDMSGTLAGESVTAISAGYFHSAATTSDGKVFAWGYNDKGQLGDGTTTSRFAPTAVNMNGVLLGKTVTAISAGSEHTVAMTSDGRLFAWGGNEAGQLGNGTNTDRLTPVSVAMNGALAGQLATAITAGDYHTLVLAVAADTKTQAPVLAAPANPTLTNSPINVIFRLPEAALADSVKLSFANGTGVHLLTLAPSQTSAGTHKFRFDPRDPTASPEITNGIVIPDGIYTVTLSYQDVRANPAASATSRNVTINTNLLLPAVVATQAANVGGQPAGTVYARFATPSAGAFGGAVQAGSARFPAVFAADGSLLLKVGGSVEKLPDALITALGKPSGDAVLAILRPGTGGITAQSDVALLRGLSTGELQIAAQTGTEITGFPSRVAIKRFGTIDGNGNAVFFLASLKGSGINASNNLALCAALGDGRAQILVKQRDQVNGKTVAIIGTLVGSAGTLAEGRWRVDDTTIGVRLTFTDKSSAIYTIPATAGSPGDWTLIAETGPSSGIVSLTGTTIVRFGLPAFGPEGMAVLAYLAKATGSVPIANDVALIVRKGVEAPALLARKGDLISTDAEGHPLARVAIKRLTDPVVGGGGAVAFFFTATGTDVGADIAYAADGTAWNLLANVGSAVPAGGQWASFSSLVLPNGMQSGPLVLGKLKASISDNITEKNDLGLYGVSSDGKLQLLIKSGETVSLGSISKTLKTFSALAPTPGSIGAASGYDDANHVSVVATFTDMTQAVLRLTVP